MQKQKIENSKRVLYSARGTRGSEIVRKEKNTQSSVKGSEIIRKEKTTQSSVGGFRTSAYPQGASRKIHTSVQGASRGMKCMCEKREHVKYLKEVKFSERRRREVLRRIWTSRSQIQPKRQSAKSFGSPVSSLLRPGPLAECFGDTVL